MTPQQRESQRARSSAARALRRVARLLPLCAWVIAAVFVEVLRLVPAVGEATNRLRWKHVRNLPHRLKRVLQWILRQTFPLVDCVLFQCKLAPRLLAAEESDEFGEEHSDYLDVELDELHESHEIELTRRAAVQQRVQGNAATIAVVTGLLAVGLGLLQEDLLEKSDPLTTLLRVLLTCAVAWLVMSGVSAIRAVGINRQYDRWLQTRDPASVLDVTDAAKKMKLVKMKLVKMILLNQGYTLIITNYAMASHISMRNAFIAMGGIVIAILWLR